MTFNITREGNLIRLRTKLETGVCEELQIIMDAAKKGLINNIAVVFTTKGSVEANSSFVGDSIPMINWLLDCGKEDLQRVFNPEQDSTYEVED